MAALRRAKLNPDQIYISLWLYSCFLFLVIMDANLWYMVVADRPIPPVAEKTMGEKEAYSISEIFSSSLAHVSGTGLKELWICSWVHVG